MPTLNEVIDEFKLGFQYLNSEGKRNTRWFELGFSIFSNADLTSELEAIATDLNSELASIKSNSGSLNFEDNSSSFTELLKKTIKQVLAQRFVYGDLNTENYDISNSSHRTSELLRFIMPKNPGLLEKMFIKGLVQVCAKYPELSHHFDDMIKSLKHPHFKATQVFYEHSKYVNGGFQSQENFTTTMKDKYMDKQARQSYADNELSKIKL